MHQSSVNILHLILKPSSDAFSFLFRDGFLPITTVFFMHTLNFAWVFILDGGAWFLDQKEYYDFHC